MCGAASVGSYRNRLNKLDDAELPHLQKMGGELILLFFFVFPFLKAASSRDRSHSGMPAENRPGRKLNKSSKND